MHLSKPIAVLLLAATGLSPVHAQNLRNGQTPAEFPPASYTGTQYVDSRGCVYIRAGIDGNVTWVPRVSRDRKLLCGYEPTKVSGTSQSAPARDTSGVVQITLPPEDQPANAAPETTAAETSKPAANPLAGLFAKPTNRREPSPGPEPTVFETAKSAPEVEEAAPKTTAPNPFAGLFAKPANRREPSPGPEPTVFQTAKSAPAPEDTAPKAAAPNPFAGLFGGSSGRTPSPAPGPTVFETEKTRAAADAPVQVANAAQPQAAPCEGASELSQRYINVNGRYEVRCGPQAESPITRVVPAHVYQQREISSNLPIPDGYRAAWDDDRLNTRRAERTLTPAHARPAVVPEGYQAAWQDERLNPLRGATTAQGNAQTAALWTDDVPRQVKLPAVPQDRVIVPAETQVQRVDTDIVTKSAVTSVGAKSVADHYVRVAAFGSDAQARTAAKGLSQASGLPVRLGTARKGSQTYRVVLAGPFADDGTARAALRKVQAAGFSDARLN